MDNFAALKALVAVVETGSFQAATERLGVAKSVVSRRISQLEKHLGSRLLHRTTRRLSLTDEGQQFYQRSVQILADLEDAELATSRETDEVRGKLKLAAPLSFGLKHLSDAIVAFLKQHPATELELDLNDRNINLVEDAFDMAFRIGELEASTLIARLLGTIRNVTCASADYLQQYGEPQKPEDLSQHSGLQYTNITYRQQWTYLSEKGNPVTARPQIRMRANNGEALATAAVAGLGIASGPTFILGEFIKSGKLIPILTDYRRTAVGLYALYPPGRLTPRRVKAFSDYLASCFGDRPYWDEGLV